MNTRKLKPIVMISCLTLLITACGGGSIAPSSAKPTARPIIAPTQPVATSVAPTLPAATEISATGTITGYIFIALASCLYALLDIRSDLFTLALSGGGIVNDAVALSRLTGIPALIWSILWLIVSLWVLAVFLKSALRVAN